MNKIVLWGIGALVILGARTATAQDQTNASALRLFSASAFLTWAEHFTKCKKDNPKFTDLNCGAVATLQTCNPIPPGAELNCFAWLSAFVAPQAVELLGKTIKKEVESITGMLGGSTPGSQPALPPPPPPPPAPEDGVVDSSEGYEEKPMEVEPSSVGEHQTETSSIDSLTDGNFTIAIEPGFEGLQLQ